MRNFFILFLVLISQIASGQQWQWAKSYGGSAFDDGDAVVTDNSGNVYSLSTCSSSLVFVGNLGYTSHGGSDFLIAKYNSAGVPLWGKIIGGNLSEKGTDIECDAQGNVYFTGSFKGTLILGNDTLVSAGGEDIFFAKLDPSGNSQWAIGMGSSSTTSESGEDLVYSAFDNTMILTGSFSGSSLFQDTTIVANGTSDGFVGKWTLGGQRLWLKSSATAGVDGSVAVDVDASGNIYSCGTLTTANQTFIKKMSALGNLIWTRSASSSGIFLADGIAVGPSGEIYEAGCFSQSATFSSLTLNATSNNWCGFVVKYDNSGNSLWGQSISSTNGNIYGPRIDVDINGNCFFPAYYDYDLYVDTTEIFNPSSSADGVVIKFDSLGSVVWLKQISGSGTDAIGYVSVANGNIYFTGYLNGNGTFGSSVLTPDPSGDVFLGKFSDCTPPTTTVFPGFQNISCEGPPVVLNSSLTSSLYSYEWMSNGFPISNATGTTFTIPGLSGNSGAYAVQVTDNNGCTYTSQYVGVFIYPPPAINITTTFFGQNCTHDSIRFNATYASSNSYQWLFNNNPIVGDTNSNIMIHNSGNYQVIATSFFGCADTTATGNVTIGHYPNVFAWNDTTICQGAFAHLNANGATSYSWTPTAGVSNPNSPSTTVTPSATTTYSVVGTESGCHDTAYVNILVDPLPQPAINFNGYILSCQNSYSSYQWYYNSASLMGATYQNLAPTQNGNYFIHVTDSLGCSGNSTLIYVTNAGIVSYQKQHYILSPQPLVDQCVFQFDKPIDKATMFIYDNKGSLVRVIKIDNASSVVFDRDGLAAGLYYFMISGIEIDIMGKLSIEE